MSPIWEVGSETPFLVWQTVLEGLIWPLWAKLRQTWDRLPSKILAALWLRENGGDAIQCSPGLYDRSDGVLGWIQSHRKAKKNAQRRLFQGIIPLEVGQKASAWKLMAYVTSTGPYRIPAYNPWRTCARASVCILDVCFISWGLQSQHNIYIHTYMHTCPPAHTHTQICRNWLNEFLGRVGEGSASIPRG